MTSPIAPHRRTSKLCRIKDRQGEMIMVRPMRLKVLKQWYPFDIKKTDDWVHKTCLASLGLYPYPDRDIPLAQVIGDRVVRRICNIAAEYPDVKAPRELISQISGRLLQEFTVPTENGAGQLRWMISHWVTKNLSTGRGGVAASNDRAATGALVEVDISRGLFAGVEVCATAGAAGDPSQIPEILNLFGLSNLSQDHVSTITGCVKEIRATLEFRMQCCELDMKKTELDMKVAEKRIELEMTEAEKRTELEMTAAEKRTELEMTAAEKKHDLEVSLLREKSAADIKLRELDLKEKELELERLRLKLRQETRKTNQDHLSSSPKRKRQTVPTTLVRSGRYSISESVVHRLRDDATNRQLEAPTAETVYPIVQSWFTDRKKRFGSLSMLDVRVLRNLASLPEMWGWPAHHRRNRFEGTRHDDQLYVHVRDTIWPPPPVSDPAPSPPVTDNENGSVGPVNSSSSVSTPLRSLWTTHAVSERQQEKDIRRLCEVTNVSFEEWPTRPSVDNGVSKDVLLRWQQHSEKRKFWVTQLLSILNCALPMGVTSYLVVAMARACPHRCHTLWEQASVSWMDGCL